jgi:L-ascorbate metabolism protein UlaG (beta-lactamase superfamily)
MTLKSFLFLPIVFLYLALNAQTSDTIQTSKGNLIVHFIGHGSLMFEFNGKVIHIDPFSNVANYTTLPKADLILITHQHPDHLDSLALANIYKTGTTLYWTQECEKNSKFKAPAKIMKNGDKLIWKNVLIEAVPAYNVINKRQNGSPYHPAGEGNGYILTFGNRRVYIAGDTENIPEMLTFRPIYIAFLPMNLPYTMTPEMVKDAALMLNPHILYPYHFGKTDSSLIINLLKGNPSIEVRLRKLD